MHDYIYLYRATILEIKNWITRLVLLSGFVALLPISLNASETYRQLNLFGDVFERVKSEYVDDVSDKKLIEAAINGMLTSLDPHSSFLDKKSFREMQVQTKGEFGGIGIEVTMENGLVKVVSPIDDTPGSRAGLEPGDLITHLDGISILGLSLRQAVGKMRGPVDEEIILSIRRKNVDPFKVKIKRAIILGAGFGKRMLPISKNIPKPLIKIKGITLLENSIRFLSSLGIKHIIINSHYLYKDIKNFVKGKKKYLIKI